MTFADPLAALGVGNAVVGTPAATVEQQLSPRFADHRGVVGLPAVAVLVDEACGIPFFTSLNGTAAALQGRLSISTSGDLDANDRLLASARLTDADADYGLTVIDVTTGDGRTCALGVARNVRVGRFPGVMPTGDYGKTPVPQPDSSSARLEAIDPALDGTAIVKGLAARTIACGPLAGLLQARVEYSGSADELGYVVTTAEWMGNFMGSMHGGVIAMVLGAAMSVAAQAHTQASQGYRLSDLTVSFLRSPVVDGREVRVLVTTARAGRRVGSFSAVLLDGESVLARATGDAHYREVGR